MTTAHRATFTHAKAKNTTLTKSYQSTLTHKRALPAHTQLKYRIKKRTQKDSSSKSNTDLQSRNVNGGYLDALLQNEESHGQRKYDIDEAIPNFDNDDDDDDDDNGQSETILVSRIGKSRILGLSTESQKSGIQSTKQSQVVSSVESDSCKNNPQKIDAGDDVGSREVAEGGEKVEDSKDEDEDSEDDQSEDDESEDDTEQLLLELQKLTKEKERKRKAKEELEAEQVAANSNPLMKMDEEQEPKSDRSSWRSSTLFRNQKSSANKNDESLMFTNDTVHSEFHKRFLQRYIR